jgi:two-component system chemotaxis response regulator CheB
MTIRVLVVDDSATMRRLIAARLHAEGDIEVVAEAADPLQAREAIKAVNPDVVTLDVEMPRMDGLDFLERLMRLRPTPVVMVSSLTQGGAEASLRALELGAVECVAKSGIGDGGFDHLADAVRAAASVCLTRRPKPGAGPAAPAGFRPNGRLVAIGASTGGVEAIGSLLARFPANCPPTVIAQHMPELFTAGFAGRLDRQCAPRVVEARDGDRLAPGHVHLAPGGSHLEVVGGGSRPWRCRLTNSDRVNGHRPSVDVLFESVARACGKEAIGVILTGMGNDGAQGLLAMRQAGAATIGQDEASCTVYGMPQSAYRIRAVEAQLPLDEIADSVLRATCVSEPGEVGCRSPGA